MGERTRRRRVDAARAPALLARARVAERGARPTVTEGAKGGFANRFRCRIRDTKYSMILRPPRPSLTLSHLRQDHGALAHWLPPAPFQVASATTSSLGRAPSNSLNKACRNRDIAFHGEHPSAAPAPAPAPAPAAPAPARRTRTPHPRPPAAPAPHADAARWHRASRISMGLPTRSLLAEASVADPGLGGGGSTV
jgi:hypothetical protein